MQEKMEYRIAVSMPKDLEDKVYSLRQRDEFKRCTISEVMRQLIVKGLAAYAEEGKAQTG